MNENPNASWRTCLAGRHTSYFILHTSAERGFALIELLIAVVIFGIVATMVLTAYSRIGERLFVSALAYETGLAFRQAQSFGVSVRQVQGGGSYFDAGYGVHFSNSSDDRYVLFADRRDTGTLYQYDGLAAESGCISGTECVSVFKIQKGNKIQRFCGVRADQAGTEECNVGTGAAVAFLNVLFFRPNPDAVIRTDRIDSTYKGARVYLISPEGVTRMVEVLTTGQISIK